MKLALMSRCCVARALLPPTSWEERNGLTIEWCLLLRLNVCAHKTSFELKGHKEELRASVTIKET